MAPPLWHFKRQQLRYYKHEKPRLEDFFGDCVSFVEVPGDVRIELQVCTTPGNKYTLRSYLPPNFPHSCPALVVASPGSPLKDIDGGELQSSFRNHCYDSSRYGLTTICHCRPDRWDSEMDMRDVFMKGLIWLEAYEAMLRSRTGEDIGTFLREMPAREETLERIRKKIRRNERHGNIEELFVHFDQLMFESGSDNIKELLQMLQSFAERE
jgi:hypothetical protein